MKKILFPGPLLTGATGLEPATSGVTGQSEPGREGAGGGGAVCLQGSTSGVLGVKGQGGSERSDPSSDPYTAKHPSSVQMSPTISPSGRAATHFLLALLAGTFFPM
jgi:hypothetical protein